MIYTAGKGFICKVISVVQEECDLDEREASEDKKSHPTEYKSSKLPPFPVHNSADHDPSPMSSSTSCEGLLLQTVDAFLDSCMT
jgi:hypothetical protein